MTESHAASSTDLPTHSGSARRRALARTGLAALLVLVLALAACGGSDDDESADGSTTTGATETTAGTGGDDSGEATTTTGAAADVDICAAITPQEVEEVLAGATISSAAPMPGSLPSCQYFVDYAGTELAVAQIMLQTPDYYDGQKELQTDEVDVPALDEAILIGGNTILAKGDSGTIQVTGGVELTAGGQVASTDQLAELAQLALSL